MEKNRYPNVLSSSSICTDHVKNSAGEKLGKIEDLMMDVNSGRIAYAVLSFGGFLKLGNKLFAVLERAPGFDKDKWPDMADPAFGNTVYRHYGYKPYWEDVA
jgi:hypothetical protein